VGGFVGGRSSWPWFATSSLGSAIGNRSCGPTSDLTLPAKSRIVHLLLGKADTRACRGFRPHCAHRPMRIAVP
jgi:hypothetical protein